jgi:hypothetical protein
MKKRKPKQSQLLLLVDFLNDPNFLAPTSERKWYGKVTPDEKKSLLSWSENITAALDGSRPRLIELLAPIAEIPGGKAPPAIKRAANKRRFEALCKLTGAINSQGLRIHFHASANKRGGWRVQQTFFPPNTSPERAPTSFYDSLAEALVSGELELLRRCPHCKRFFLALKDRRARFCHGHMRLYYDDATKAKIRKELSRSKHSS